MADAAYDLNIPAMAAALRHGASINAAKARPPIRPRPLHAVCESYLEKDKRPAIRYLLAQGADINGANGENDTALGCVTRAENTELIKFLVTSGADVNAPCDGGLRPLHIAVIGGDPVSTDVLLSLGAQVDVRTDSRSTPLSMAISASRGSDATPYVHIVQSLMRAGADADVVDRQGVSILDLAQERAPALYLAMLQELTKRPSNDRSIAQESKKAGCLPVVLCFVLAALLAFL